MNTKGDANRSVRNTKRRLQSGLLALLEEKPLNKVTVRELTDLVDVNRGTFYFHYRDIYDLVREMEDQFFQEFRGSVDTPDADAHDFLPICFRYLADHADLCRMLLGEHGDPAFVEKVKAMVAEKCSALWRAKMPNVGDDLLNILNSFLIGGVVSTLQTYLEDGCSQSPEQLAEYLNDIVSNGIAPVVFDLAAKL